MKIMILCDDFPPQSFGGGGLVAFDLARELKSRGHDVLAVTTVRTDRESGTFEYGGVRTVRLSSSYPLIFQSYVSLYNVPILRQFKRVVAEFEPDVVHAHNIHAYLSYGALKIAKRSGAKVFLTAHDVMSFSHGKLVEFIDKNDLSVPTTFNYKLKPFEQLFSYRLRYNPFRNLVIRHMLRRYVDRVYAVSAAMSQAMSDNGIKGAQVIYNAIDVSRWESAPDDIGKFKSDHGLGDSVVLFGGRLSGVKGAHELILALAKVCQSVPNVQLLVIGQKNAYAERMLGIAAGLGLKDKIIFTGWLSGDALHHAYHASAMVATPSLCFDSFIMVNLEGMACRKPAITTCFGGSKEVVVDDATGYVVNPYNISVMAERLAELLKDRQKSRAFGEAGYARAKEKFSLAECALAYEREYKIYLSDVHHHA